MTLFDGDKLYGAFPDQFTRQPDRIGRADGALKLDGAAIFLDGAIARNVSVRAWVKKVSGQNVALACRQGQDRVPSLRKYYGAWFNGRGSNQGDFGIGVATPGWKDLIAAKAAADHGDFFRMEFTVEEQNLTLGVEGSVIATATDNTLDAPGYVVLDGLRGKSFVKKLQVKVMDKPAMPGRVFMRANGEPILGELISVNGTNVEILIKGATAPLKVPVSALGPLEASYLASWKPGKDAGEIVRDQSASLWSAIAARTPDVTVIGAGKPALALIETWRLPDALPYPAYWRTRPLYVSPDGLTVIGLYDRKGEGADKGLFRWQSGKGVAVIQPSDLPKEVVLTRYAPDSREIYALEVFKNYLHEIRGKPTPRMMSNTWGCSLDRKIYVGSSGSFPVAEINGALVDLEYAARRELGLRTSLPWYVYCLPGGKADDPPRLAQGVWMMAKASAVSDDGKTVAGFGDVGAWVMHSPAGLSAFASGEPDLNSDGEAWMSLAGRNSNPLLEKALLVPGIARLGLEASDLRELLDAYFVNVRDPLSTSVSDQAGKVKIYTALSEIAAGCPPISSVSITFTAEERALLVRRLLLRLRLTQDIPSSLVMTNETKSVLAMIEDGKWPCAPPLEDRSRLKEWYRLVRSSGFHPQWDVTGKGGMTDVLYRLKMKAGLRKAKEAVGNEVWDQWSKER